MEPPILGIVLDSSIIIEAERKRQTVEALLQSIQQHFGEVEITMSAVCVAELVHGVARANSSVRWKFIQPIQAATGHAVTGSN